MPAPPVPDTAPPARDEAASPAPPACRSPLLVWPGRILSAIGHFSLPLGLGAILGFYAADQGMTWLPRMLELVLLVFLIGFLAMPLGRALQGAAYRDTPEHRRLRRRIFVCLVLAAVCVTGRLVVFWMQMPSPLTKLPEPAFNAAFAADAQRYREFDLALEEMVAFLERQDGMFPAANPKVLSADDEKTLLNTWAGIYDLSFALDQIRVFYEDYYRFDASRAQRSLHLRSYLLTYAAELALYEKATRLVQLLDRNPHAVKFLDAPHPSHKLPADTFSHYREELQGSRDRSRVIAGRQYLRWLASGLNARTESAALGCEWLWERAEKHLARIDAIDPDLFAAASIASDLQSIKQSFRRKWYPAQSSVAEWMGDTRVHRVGQYLITEKLIAETLPKLEPGDILLVRKNWYLSNVGLPGFWPHAVLYIGDPAQLRTYFDTPEVREWVRRQPGSPETRPSVGQTSSRPETLADLLAARWPAKWLEYQAGHEGDSYRVVEAISEGVVFNTMKHASGDYLAVLRPRLDRVAKAQAIVEAFGHLGKPYDYEFDFATDHALVCTELVWRSYRPADGKHGLDFPLQYIAGRWTLPANDIAARFAAEHGQPNAQLDFVYFIDASEAQARAFAASEADFIATPQRTKWDLALD